ncbi:PDR/VanB family oxidoreductase [Pseudomonas putida]|uniref:PDR/VanB family oxidoreductase n=1 Tax=Pseudomonas putida TaxID=303 RepID=UPI002271A9F4|nr:PDR/VanB family oxidoreductase [Pseudomonas putida]WAB99751.1 PDR/VanB family oxidoreductase [Pseudomonas putida]
MENSILLKVARIRDVALGIREIELLAADGNTRLPEFSPGAHIEIKLTENLYRCYSLANNCADKNRYVIAVHNSPESKGGSLFIHHNLKVNDIISSSPPRNNFPLNEAITHNILIAGGIGITPLLSMAYRLSALGTLWELHYCCRTEQHAAYKEELSSLAEQFGGKVHYHFDQAGTVPSLNIAHLCSVASADAHLYCCGPQSMLNAFEAATVHRKATAHLEYFSAKVHAARDGGYEIELARTRAIFNVPAGKSILDVVFEAGISVPSSCREGICGSCETRIISGEADHRDALLSDAEKASNTTMMICCSGAKSKRLVLDL